MRGTASFADAAAEVWSSTTILHLRSTATQRQPPAARPRRDRSGMILPREQARLRPRHRGRDPSLAHRLLQLAPRLGSRRSADRDLGRGLDHRWPVLRGPHLNGPPARRAMLLLGALAIMLTLLTLTATARERAGRKPARQGMRPSTSSASCGPARSSPTRARTSRCTTPSCSPGPRHRRTSWYPASDRKRPGSPRRSGRAG